MCLENISYLREWKGREDRKRDQYFVKYLIYFVKKYLIYFLKYLKYLRRIYREIIDFSRRDRMEFIENHFISLSFISLGQKRTRDFTCVFFRTRGTEAFNFERVNVFNFTAKSVRCRTLRAIDEALARVHTYTSSEWCEFTME